jgi:hypothetical protein
MASISARNDTYDVLNVFLVGPDLSIAPCYGLVAGGIVTFPTQPFLDYALGAFSTTTGALVFLVKARPDTGLIPIVQNQFAVHAATAQMAASGGPAKPGGHKQRGAVANPTVHPEFSITVPVTVPIGNDGSGSNSGTYPTGGASITGSYTIKSPPGGTWSIIATDQNGQVIFSNANAVQGVAYPIPPYQSGDSTTVTVRAQWSIHQSANLQVSVTLNLN